MSDEQAGEVEWEYRVQRRRPTAELPALRDWQTVMTGRGAGRPYRTLGAAKGVLTGEKRDDDRTRQTAQRFGREPEPGPEYRVQKRPVSTQWEDVVIDS